MSQRFLGLYVAVIVGLFGAVAGTALAVNIETVPVGNPGNAGELSGLSAGGAGPDRVCGAVNYTYNIGKYEVTAVQYAEFLNAVAATDTYGLYNTNMWSDYRGCMILRSGASGSYTYSVAADYANRPVNFVSWVDAARFANWLHNNQPTGAQGLSTTEDGAYYLNGATSDAAILAVNRNSNWRWAITSEDEWYKAAYHKNDGVTGNYWDYPAGSNNVPGRDVNDLFGNNANYYGIPYPIQLPYYTTMVGEFHNSPSPYGTFDQGGNVWEWNESILATFYRGLRGASFSSVYYGDYLHAFYRLCYYMGPTAEVEYFGFRVSANPVHAADLDADADVDLIDFARFQTCFNGPNRPAAQGCAGADFDHDADVDLTDFTVFQACFNGANRPPKCWGAH